VNQCVTSARVFGCSWSEWPPLEAVATRLLHARFPADRRQRPMLRCDGPADVLWRVRAQRAPDDRPTGLGALDGWAVPPVTLTVWQATSLKLPDDGGETK
jgi:hypothetical protein